MLLKIAIKNYHELKFSENFSSPFYLKTTYLDKILKKNFYFYNLENQRYLLPLMQLLLAV